MSAIPVSELGLNSSEARYLQQQIAASQQGSNSSRAASHASSQGRLLLDPTSLQALSAHFDRLMYSIQQRWHYYDRAGNAIQMADAEIARFRAILREIDELQTEFDKVRRIGEIVKGFRSRVDRLDRRI
ncbi:hypothetical protein SNOG_07742 [Parastagonospora nodorum SN15]|uniref:Biogenesis of lysosome-related organelles complex 1 subunit CNL1 n=1 Tax=Phaeosphaeria nodorum (strain SN15 / ATCC MYA-4574 / FGSC 10173) TaxID=321614 RepID=Q0UKH2_PHANO|nr:hypothetical protein SNOG_07742 [Parastagonospora nodorum SN15]EAT85208.2 hypothetical protein SNOG_07742 [Parastagonospora nodorum SN15]